MKRGDTVYRLMPSGTLFTYKVLRAHSDDTVTVEKEGVFGIKGVVRMPACNFTKSPTEQAKPVVR